MLALDVSHQTIVEGVCFGLGYGLLAVGFVLLYRTSRVINLAYAQVGAFASAVLLVLVAKYGWNYWIAAAIALVIGAFIGGVIELSVIRRLAKAPKVVVLVATAGVAQLLVAAQMALPGVGPTVKRYPVPFTWRGSVGDAVVRSDHLIALVVAPIVVVALALFLSRSIWGVAIRGSASNADAARLAGIPAPRLSTIVWAIGGVLATVTQLMTRPLIGVGATTSVSLDASTLVIALAAATVARMRSLPVALATGVALGVVQRTLLINYSSSPGVFDLVLGGIIVVAVLTWGGQRSTEEGQEWAFVPSERAVPTALLSRWWVRRSGLIGYTVVGLAAIALPLVVEGSSRHFLYTRIVVAAIIALSVTLLTGWAGQLSLGQYAFAGVGAFVAIRLTNEGLGFYAAIVIAGAVSAAVALIVGLPALRVRGLLLSVITLAFAVMATFDIFRRILGTERGQLVRPTSGPLDLSDQRTFYWFCLAILVAVVVMVSRIRVRGSGRSLVAVRSNELNAAALAISPARQKMTAFAVAGALAGIAGVLLVANSPTTTPVDSPDFAPIASISVVAMAVIGGLTSVRGALLGALWVVGLPAFFPGSSAAPLLTSGVGLLVVLMYFPGGLDQVLGRARSGLFEYVERRLSASGGGEATPDRPRTTTAPSITPAVVAGDSDAPALRTRGVCVRFGGNVAVDHVSITVGRGEIVGLIGANGAGKSTLMNAIGGYVPSTGDVMLHGVDINRWSPARRSRSGLGRGFQNAGLFPELAVREVIQVALERPMPTSWLATLSGWPSGRAHERRIRGRADEIIDLVGLGRYADSRVGTLSTGTRRIVELACLIAHGGSVLCLDEPTAGVAQKETEAFGPLLRDVGRQLGASMIVIEHDMPLIMSISDRVYCMEAGSIIAEGDPLTVRNDPLVIASYLGTDVRAIERSDSRS